MKRISSLLLSVLILSGCSDSDDMIPTETFTYQTSSASPENFYIFILSLDGNLLDSANLSGKSMVTLEIPSSNERYTIAHVQGIGDEGVYCEVFTHVSTKNWDRTSSGKRTNIPIHIEIEDKIGTYGFSGWNTKSASDFTNYEINDLDYDNLHASPEGKLFVDWVRSGDTPMYKMYDNLTSDQTLNVIRSNFQTMKFHEITSTSNFTTSTLFGHTTEHRYRINHYPLSNDTKRSMGAYYPDQLFNSFELTIRFDNKGIQESIRSIYKGNLPQTVEPLDIGGYTPPSLFKNFTQNSSNEEVDVIFNWFGDNSVSMSVFGPNHVEINIESLENIINNTFKNIEVSFEECGGATIVEYDGIDYDQFIDQYLNNSRRTEAAISKFHEIRFE